MNEKTKQQKNKGFFKRHWLNIVKSLSAVSAFIFAIFKLSNRVSRSNKYRDDAVRRELDGLESDIGSTTTEVEEIRELHGIATETTNSLKQQTGEIRESNRDAIEISSEVGEGIRRIKQLIETERKRLEENEAKQ